MSDSLATYYVDLQVKTDDLEKQLNVLKSKVEAQSNSFANSFKSVAIGVGSLVAGLQALSSTIDFAADSVKAYIESAGAFNKVEAIIKSTGMAAGFTAEQLSDIAGELSKLAGIDDDKILNDVSANLLTFKNVSGDVFKSAQQSILDISAVIGSDLKSQTIQLGKALNDPIQGMSALARVGIQFSDSQKEQIKTMIQHNDLLGAQKLMLKEIESEFGGAAEAANKANGGLNNLSVTFGNFKEMVGQVILTRMQPFIELGKKLFDWLNPQVVQSNFEKVTESTTKLSDRFSILQNMVESLGSKTNRTKEEQKSYIDSVKALQTEYPNYFKGLDLTKSKFEDIKTAMFNARKELDNYIQSMINQAIAQDKLDVVIKAGKDLQKAVEEREKGKAQSKLDASKTDVLHGGKASNLDNADAQKSQQVLRDAAAKFADDNVVKLQKAKDDAEKAYSDFVNGVTKIHSVAPSYPSKSTAEASTGDVKDKFNVQLELEKIYAKQVDDLRQKELDDAQIAYDTDVDKYQKSLDKKEMSREDYEKLQKSRLNQLYTDQERIVNEYNKKEELEELDTQHSINQQNLQLHKATELEKLKETRSYLAKQLEIYAKYGPSTARMDPRKMPELQKNIREVDTQIKVSEDEYKTAKTESYYEKRKFLDDNYYSWKKEKIKEEYDLNIKNGLDLVIAQKEKNASLEQLDEERKAFILDTMLGVSSVQNTLVSVFGNIADAMVGDFDLASLRIKDIMKDMVKSVLNELAKIAAKKAVMGIINFVTGGLGSIIGGIGSMLGGLFGSAGGSSMAGDVGDTGLFANMGSGQGSMMAPIQSQGNDSQVLLAEIRSSIQALNQNIMNKEFSNAVTINSVFDPEKFVVENNNAEFKVRRSGKNLDGN